MVPAHKRRKPAKLHVWILVIRLAGCIQSQAMSQALADLVLDTRRAKGWTQQDLAHHAGLSIKPISVLENGGAVSKTTVRLVCEALGLEVPSPASVKAAS